MTFLLSVYQYHLNFESNVHLYIFLQPLGVTETTTKPYCIKCAVPSLPLEGDHDFLVISLLSGGRNETRQT